MRSLLRITASRREMCDAAVTKVRYDRVQFISRASIPFSLFHGSLQLWVLNARIDHTEIISAAKNSGWTAANQCFFVD